MAIIRKNRYQVRSVSLPARSHLSILRIEEELNKLKQAPSSPPTAETICIALLGLKKLYERVQDFLQLPVNQQGHNDKWVDEVLDGPVGLLDMCDITKNILLQTKVHAQDIQSGLCRRSGESSLESTVCAYRCNRKKMKKEITKCLAALKRMETKFCSTPIVELGHHLSVVVIRLLRDISGITISIFQSLMTFMSMSTSKPKCLLTKLLHIRQVKCEEQEVTNMVAIVDIALRGLCGNVVNKDVLMKSVQLAQENLTALEVCIEGFEDRLEVLFKCLIQTRISLLNNLS
ncbi:hypothetical protein GIB67_006993 [Kingdonia uniflora]|uniref:Uncharacterized protein n=1 Tax=Kingdonia uniflora TaxID=39325 RepID=A0A7J7NZG7_9MAGN|nr:hypothetical protein GIB67_006993 [Kingdonia uniflora]